MSPTSRYVTDFWVSGKQRSVTGDHEKGRSGGAGGGKGGAGVGDTVLGYEKHTPLHISFVKQVFIFYI